MFMRTTLTILFAAGCLASLTGCGSDSHSYVKVIQIAPGSSNVDVKVGGDFAAKNLASGSASGGYMKVGAGSGRQVQVFAAGDDKTALALAKQDLFKNRYYTAIMMNVPSSLQVRIENDDLTPPLANNAKFRIIQGLPAAGSVDVYLTAPGMVIDDPKKPVIPLFSNLAFGETTKYVDVPAGTYQIRITAVGNPSNVIDSTGFDTTGAPKGVPLSAGDIYTAALDLIAPQNHPLMLRTILLTQDTPVPGVPPTAPKM